MSNIIGTNRKGIKAVKQLQHVRLYLYRKTIHVRLQLDFNFDVS